MTDPLTHAALRSRPLVPGDFPVAPYRDASPQRHDPVALRALAHDLGYLYLPSVIPEALVDAARAEIRAHGETCGWFEPGPGNEPTVRARPGACLSGRGFDDPDWVALQRHVNADSESAFATLGRAVAALGVVDTLYGAEPAALARANIAWVKLPGSPQHTTRPHQDIFYAPACPDLWTAWLPLVETDLDLGPLAVAPGSHRRGVMAHLDALTGIAMAAKTPWASGPVRPGDVVFFGALCVHAAWSNVTPDRARVSADFRFLRRSSPPIL